MEVFQLNTNSWFLPRDHFLPDPLAPQHPPLLCHILTGALAVALPFRLSALQYEENLLGYLWRFKAGDGVLRVYNVTLLQVLRSEAELQVLCERICFRPEAVINSLPVEQQLYFVGAVVKAAQALSAKFGFFGITPEMVGLDRRGEVRVWINSNHAENRREMELESEEQQFSALMRLFSQLKVQNRLVNAYLQNISDMGIGFSHHADYHQKFLRLHHIRPRASVSVGRLAGEGGEREVESCPASSVKLANETADMTSTLKQNSINAKTVTLTKSTEFGKRFPLAPRLPLLKENRRSSDKNTKTSLKSSFCKSHIGVSQESQGGGQILATRAKLEESFFIEESSRPASVAVELNLLGKMGRLCESMTPEELILEQFKTIYQ